MSKHMRPPLPKNRIAMAVASLSLVPYVSLLAYMSFSMHNEERLVHAPSTWFLLALFILGVMLPLAGTSVILRSLVKHRDEFRLRLLLESYFSLILLFATAYALLQTSSDSTSIRGMATVWVPTDAMTFSQHADRLHQVYIDALYLSAITITTVGYGDMNPDTAVAKLIAALEGVVGVGFLGLAVGHYFSVCIHRRQPERRLDTASERVGGSDNPRESNIY